MLNRVFKTIFILTLCLGISLPANAGNVNVSEGSAFITKSELSYQLNVLSQRMTQLENSLDSKIDKLVSSYLTRNGIWSGVPQQINTSSWSITDTSLPGFTSGRSYDTTLNRQRIVNKINKSGYCSIVMSQKSQYSERIFGMWYKAGTGNARVYDSTFAIFGYITNKSGTVDASAKISYPVGLGFGKCYYDGNGTNNTGGNASQSFGVWTQTTEVIKTYYFFVEKGDFLDTYMHVAYYIPSGCSFSAAGQKITFNIKSMNVY